MAKYLEYLRKSRADGENETIEAVLERHEKILHEYAEKNGIDVSEADIYREVVSGETIQDRPVINKLLTRIQNEDIKGVLVVEPQRLSRGDLSDCGTIIRAFRYTDTLIVTPTKTYDLSEKFDRKFFEMELTRGNDYLEYVKEIMMRGRLASVSEGNYIGSLPPYGYDKVKVGKNYTLQENSESDTVRLIFDLFVNEGLGTVNIANRLNELGIKPKKIGFWTNSTIRDILRNPVYIGKIRWNWRKTIKKYENGEIVKSRPKSSAEDWMLVEGKHEGIVTEEIFNAAQKRWGTFPKVKHSAETVNPFAGLVHCECGYAMIMQKNAKSSPRVVCRNQARCGNKSATFEEFEEAVIESLSSYIAEFKMLAESGNKVKLNSKETAVKKLEKTLKDLELQQERLYDFLEDGTYSKSVFAKRNQALAEKRSKTLSALEAARMSVEPTPIDYREKIVLLTDAVTALKDNNLSAAVKNSLLKNVVKEIRYSRRTANRTKWDKTPFHIEVLLKF